METVAKFNNVVIVDNVDDKKNHYEELSKELRYASY